jgi:twitching motility protein PilT
MIRVHGDIEPIDFPEITPDGIISLLNEIMPERNRKEFAERNDTDFAYEIPDLARFRSNIFQDISGMGGVFRVIPSKIITPEDLKLSKSVTELAHLSKGLALVTGPTGSGKSTTLAALVDLVNRLRSDHIITIEDPIEFVHKDKKCLVNQREVHSHTESFASAIRAALRQDPDIVLVGEMRDLETIETAIETAETGHLVFGTLHTTTAASTVDRIIDSFPANRQNQVRSMLSISLKGVIAQTLCKRVDNKGRIAALEVLIVTPPIAALIRDSKTFQIPSAMQVAGAQGMILMNDSLFKLVKEGVVDAREAYIKAVDKDGLIAKYKNAGIILPPLEQTGDSPSVVLLSTIPTPATPPPVRKKSFFG